MLFPMLFNINMNILGVVIGRSGIRCHQYADITKIYFSVISESGKAMQALYQCLDTVVGYMRAKN